MVECTNIGNSRGVFQRLEQTGKSDHYGAWHSHDWIDGSTKKAFLSHASVELNTGFH